MMEQPPKGMNMGTIAGVPNGKEFDQHPALLFVVDRSHGFENATLIDYLFHPRQIDRRL